MARFVNPYNFIPLGKGNADASNYNGREAVYRGNAALKSGWIDVSMLVRTPLIVPDGAHPEYYDVKTDKKIEKPTEEQRRAAHKKYSFYHIGEEGRISYVVPGSELRGMVRSVYEAITDSCFPFLLNDKPIGQRVPTFGSFQRRGLLEYNKKEDQWFLWETYAEKENCNVRGEKIYYKNEEYRCGQYKEGYGYVQCNIPVSNKTNYHIAFLKVNGEKPFYVWKKGADDPYRMLKYVLGREDVSGSQKNPNKLQAESLQDYLERVKKHGGMVPVWFLAVDREGVRLVYLSNSSIGRVAQLRKWENVFAHHKPCADKNKLCPACMLFGTIKGEGMKGRVRFSDAECEQDMPERENYLLDILGEPRTSAFEFYLRKPSKDATYWNFDFYGHKIRDKNGRDKNEYLDLAEATPRGRKMYWHGKPVEGKRCTNLNATMEGVKAKTRFRFKIYFDQITERQLEDLIWVLSLGENKEDSSMLHKLGHARPLGYGSVKLWVSQYHVREISCKNGDISVEVKHYPVSEHPICNFDKNSAIYKSLMAMCNADSVTEKEVRYPRYIKVNSKSGTKDDSIYQWFSNNRKNINNLKILPEPFERDITLYGSWLDCSADDQEQRKLKNQKQNSALMSLCRYKGTIKKKIAEKGYGFISYDEGEIFFHYSELCGGLTMESLELGDVVWFEIGTGKGKTVAKRISQETF